MISEVASASDKIKKIELDRERDIADAEKAYASRPRKKKDCSRCLLEVALAGEEHGHGVIVHRDLLVLDLVAVDDAGARVSRRTFCARPPARRQ